MPEVDWVTARGKCSLFEVFSQLRSGVQQDIDTRVALLQPGDRMNFKVREELNPDPERFVVLRLKDRDSAALEFSCREGAIYVTEESGKVKLSATLTLNDEAQCRLRVESDELECWQFRRRALEDFFRF